MDDKYASEENNMTSAKYYTMLHYTEGFCQVKKNRTIREKLGSGCLGQGPIRIIFWGIFCVFCVFCGVVFVESG